MTMSTRLGGRDTGKVIELSFYNDDEYLTEHLEFLDCVGPTLKMSDCFPLFRLEKGDQIIKLNKIDVRTKTKEDFMDLFNSLDVNFKEATKKGKEVVRITYIPAKDVKPIHLSKDRVHQYLFF